MREDGFENRLDQGLKRWAQSGQPSLDLEAYVRKHAGGANNSPSARLSLIRRWTHRMMLPAAAAALFMGLPFSFPIWAGAAAEWPLVGPAVTEIIFKDAGLTWAYAHGIMKGTLAQAKDGDVEVRIVGIMADASRTTLIYQIAGVPERAKTADTGAASGRNGSLLTGSPQQSGISLSIAKAAGEYVSSWTGTPVWTPAGLVGTVSTVPLKAESGSLDLMVRVGEKNLSLRLDASRAESGKFSQEIPVQKTVEVDGIKMTLDTVIYTPAETVVRYRVEKTEFEGRDVGSTVNDAHYLEVNGKRLYATQAHGTGEWYVQSFPAVEGVSRLVIPSQVKGVKANLLWSLQSGMIQQADGAVITLDRWEHRDGRLAFSLTAEGNNLLRGLGMFEIVDAKGVHHTMNRWKAAGVSVQADGRTRLAFEAELAPGIDPVAIRATQIGLHTDGPWTFDLPDPSSKQ